MSLECTMCDQNDSVFFSALPYGAVSLGAACGGTYVALTAYATGATVAAVAGVALAIFGSTAFVATTITAIYSKNSCQFKKSIGPAIKSALAITVADMIASVAKVVLIKLIEDFLYGRERRA